MWMMSVPIATCAVTGIYADLRKRGLGGIEELADRLTEPEAGRHAVVDRAIQLRPGLLRHPERAGPQRGINVLGRAAGKCDLEIVNHAGAVGRDRRHEPALHQVDEDR
jgi:hypothetical protein